MLPHFLHTQFPHIRQKSRWDCGLACVAMVAVGMEAPDFHPVLERLQDNFGTRPWTVDLCSLLHTLKVPYTHFTEHGPWVNETLSKLPYYASKYLREDTLRISVLLRSAPVLSDNTTLFSLDDLTLHKRLEEGPLIVLINGNGLRCPRCPKNKLWRLRRRSFLGHYILVVGWGLNLEKATILYRDPASSHELCEIPLEKFNKVRLAFGTDGDVIAIRIPVKP